MRIQVKDLKKAYGDIPVLNGISLIFEENKTYCLMGNSGCGKTTLLRILAGLEKQDGGSVEYECGKDRIPFSFVFQEDRLCEEFSVEANVRMGNRALPEEELLQALEAFGLADRRKEKAEKLSGGMKRRVAILRGLLAPGEVLLMDEPFKGLDEDRKKNVMEYVKRKCRNRLVILVTHEEKEAAFMEGEIYVLENGKLKESK